MVLSCHEICFPATRVTANSPFALLTHTSAGEATTGVLAADGQCWMWQS